MKKYKHIFFDLDHTLWDFEKNSDETLQELFYELKIGELGSFTLDDFMGHFRRIHHHLWDLFNQQLIDRHTIRTQRFKQIREALSVAEHPVFEQFSDAYIQRCPQKPHLIPHTVEVLDYLKNDYHLHIISNGFDEIQAVKMKSSGILHYFKTIVTSETTGARKPSKEIFEYALKASNASTADSLMIGDNLLTDIGGATNANLDSVFYNPEKLTHTERVTFEISSLCQIKELL